MSDRFGVLFGQLKRLVGILVGPLRKDPDATKFDLAIPETHNTTIDGDTGWASRPSAWLACPRCGADIHQRDAREKIDCPRCVAVFPPAEFADLTLRRLQCPVCGDAMEHGIRHPNAFDVPEWATCHRCRYHWEFGHLF
ncbi:hypothetical protein ACFPYI_12415 [Halomarina salina]|uniref:Uncharacterized protein n=1 Tax=Halomarina salina TaxID=1872699 RepID=A0ABD5RPD8_9EURY|nr:hypothetical protein [Halomarina salina]